MSVHDGFVVGIFEGEDHSMRRARAAVVPCGEVHRAG